MSKYTRTQITQLSSNESTAIQQINKNFTDIQEAIQDCISRSGQAPSHLTSDLDLNGNRIINAPAPKTDRDFVRRIDVVEDISLVRELVNSASTASAQAVKAAAGVQNAIADNNVGVVADDLILGDNSNIRRASSNLDVIYVVSQDIANVSYVGKNIESVKSVSANESNINAVNENKTNINTCADNIGSILEAPNQAESARAGAESARLSAESAASSAAVSNPPPLLTHSWEDHILNDIRYLRADTFSWQSGEVYKSAYEHLVEDYNTIPTTKYYAWCYPGQVTGLESDTFFTLSPTPDTGDALYYIKDGSLSLSSEPIMIADLPMGHINVDGLTYNRTTDLDISVADAKTETIGSNTITYYQADDGHKIVLPDMEATVQAIYEETGVAWYYILDVANKRFKLPRELPITDKSKGNGMALGLSNGTIDFGMEVSLYQTAEYLSGNTRSLNKSLGALSGTGTKTGYDKVIGVTTDPTKSGIISHRENGNGQQYLYFYVGNYTKSAIEQTAGITTEVLNGKMDKSDMQVVSELPAAPVEGVYYFVKE